MTKLLNSAITRIRGFTIALSSLLLPQLAIAQCADVCKGTAYTKSISGYQTTGYTQVYYLTNAAGIVQSTIASGGTGTDNLSIATTALAAGTYNVYALNYNTTAAPAPLPAVGTNVNTVGTTTAGCYNGDFLTNFVCFTVFDKPTVAPTTVSACADTDNVVLTANAAGGTGALTYTWAGTPAGSGTDTYTVTTPPLSANGSVYSVTVTDTKMCSATSTVVAIVTNCAPIVCTDVCKGATYTKSISGYATTGYTQVYYLTNAAGIVQSTIASGGTGTDNLSIATTALAAGTYNVYALNYNTTAAPAPLPTVGTNVNTVGTTTAGCYNGDFLANFVCFTVLDKPTVAPTTVSACADTDNVVLTANAAGGTGALTYTWAGTPAGSGTDTYTVTTPPLSANGSVYSVTVTDTKMCSATSTVVAIVTNCAPIVCTPLCEGTPYTKSISGFATTGYTQVYYVTDAAGIVLAITPTVTTPVAGTNDISIATGGLSGTYNVYALNYNTTAAPTPLPTVGANINTVGTTTPGCYNSDVLTNYVCFTVTPLPVNPGALTTVNPTTGNFPACLNTATNGGIPFGPEVVNNTCMPADATPSSGLTDGNNGSTTATNTSLSLRAACTGSLDFDNAPLIYTVQCDADGGILDITVDPLTTTSGTITQFEAALYGPVSAACPTVSGGSFVDCNSNTNGDPMPLTATAGPGEVYLVLIDSDGGTGTFEISGGNSALPIELLSFTGKINGSVNDLFWTTVTEQNTKWHIVERSATGTGSFSEVGRVAAAGTSTSMLNYQLKDEKPLVRSYYRLRTIDLDGTSSLSNTVLLERKKGSFGAASVYPVPTNGQVTVSYETVSDAPVTFSIVDVLGRVLSTEKVAVNTGLNTKTFDLSNFASAVYFIVMEDNTSNRQTLRVVKTGH